MLLRAITTLVSLWQRIKSQSAASIYRTVYMLTAFTVLVVQNVSKLLAA